MQDIWWVYYAKQDAEDYYKAKCDMVVKQDNMHTLVSLVMYIKISRFALVAISRHGLHGTLS